MAVEEWNIEEFLASSPRIQCSVQNVRTERLSREMNTVATAFYKDIFAVIFYFIELEVSCVLDFNSKLNLFALQLNSEISEM